MEPFVTVLQLEQQLQYHHCNLPWFGGQMHEHNLSGIQMSPEQRRSPAAVWLSNSV